MEANNIKVCDLAREEGVAGSGVCRQVIGSNTKRDSPFNAGRR
jgi:hypothetical protein